MEGNICEMSSTRKFGQPEPICTGLEVKWAEQAKPFFSSISFPFFSKIFTDYFDVIFFGLKTFSSQDLYSKMP